MTDFILVHGGMHDSWCWTRLRSELGARGHRTWAVDLPCDDAAAGAATYATVVAADCTDARDDAVIVGHSLGGLTIPLVAGLRSVGRLVFLSAGVPEVGSSFSDQLINHGAAPDPFPAVDSSGLLTYDAQTARAMFYPDCEPAITEVALTRLRPQALTPMVEVTPLTEWPEVAITTIHGRDDRLIPPLYAEMASKRLGSDLHVLDGGHSLFLSRADEVADLLESLAP